MIYIMNSIERKVFVLNPSWSSMQNEKSHGKTEDASILKDRSSLCVKDFTRNEFNEIAILSGPDYKKLFGDTNANVGSKFTVVKITNPQTGKSIHRLYRTSSSVRGMNNYIGLSYTSLLSLSKDQESFDNMDQLLVEPGSRVKYYAKHPDLTTRIMLWGTIISVVLSVLSIIISVA